MGRRDLVAGRRRQESAENIPIIGLLWRSNFF
jgi:hypothetical protein